MNKKKNFLEVSTKWLFHRIFDPAIYFIYLFLKIFWPYHAACGISVPDQGSNAGHSSDSAES